MAATIEEGSERGRGRTVAAEGITPKAVTLTGTAAIATAEGKGTTRPARGGAAGELLREECGEAEPETEPDAKGESGGVLLLRLLKEETDKECVMG